MPGSNLEEAERKGIVGRNYNSEAAEKEIDMLLYLSLITYFAIPVAMFISSTVALKTPRGSVHRAASGGVASTLFVLVILVGTSELLGGIPGEVVEVCGSEVVLRTGDGRDLIVDDGNVPGIIPGDQVLVGRSGDKDTNLNYKVRSVMHRSAPTTPALEP